MKYWIGAIMILALIAASYWAGIKQKDSSVATATQTPTPSTLPPSALPLIDKGEPEGDSGSKSGVIGNKPGDYAPDFSLRDLNGAEISMRAYFGHQNVRLIFWTSDCPACLSAMQSSNTFTFAINRAENAETARQFSASQGPNLKILLDPNDIIYRLYNGTTMPYTVNIDERGIIR